VVELIDYTQRCAALLQCLIGLMPVALTSLPQWAFGL